MRLNSWRVDYRVDSNAHNADIHNGNGGAAKLDNDNDGGADAARSVDNDENNNK